MPEMPQTFTITLLDTKKHDRAAFSCGEPSLDTYLQRQASQDIKRRAAALHVMTESSEATHILGYYTLSTTGIKLADLPEGAKKRMARYEDVSAVLLGRLAVDEHYKGQKLGGQLLKHAMMQALTLSENVAVTVFVVDALNESAKRFYEHYGFSELTRQPMRLFLPLRTLEQSLKI